MRMIEKMTGSHLTPPAIENLVTICGRGEMRFPQIVPQPKQLSLL
jgi:hypothetical protein